MQYLAKCDLIVYDLHFGNPNDVLLALKALEKPAAEGEERPTETVLILISSLLAWDRTPRNMQEIVPPAEARKRAEEAAERQKEQEETKIVAEEDEPKDESDEDEDQEKDAEEVMSEKVAAAPVQQQIVPEVKAKKSKNRFVHHPFTEADYLKRQASKEMQRIKDIEDKVLQFKKEGIKTFVISTGVLYGQGEEVFDSHFKQAWLQNPERLPIVGEGNNLVPTIHVTDLARMVKKVHEAPPERQYIFGIDNTKKPTQKKLIQAISDGIGTGLTESIDIPIEFDYGHAKLTPIQLTSNWKKFLMLNIKATPSSLFVTQKADGEEAEADGGEGEGEGGFNWHCKDGLAKNIQRVKEEFCKKRNLKPFKTFITGKPCAGKSHFSAQLS